MKFLRKHLYLFSFIVIFLLLSIWDDHSSLLANLLYSLGFVLVYAFIDWRLNNQKYEKK